MSAKPASPRPAAGFAGSAAFAAGRGAALVGVALVVGIVLLQVVDDPISGPKAPTGAVVTTSTTTPLAPGEVPTTVVARDPAQVRVVVLNGQGVAGAAKAVSDDLATKGYNMLTAGDADARVGTVVSCRTGFDREAAALVTAIAPTGTKSPKAQPMPAPPPEGAEDADCAVILGSEE